MAQTTGGIEKPTRTRTGGHKAVASTPPDSAAVTVKPSTYERTPVLDEAGDTVKFEPNDSLILAQATFVPDTAAATNLGKLRVFNPDPKRAMWLSALCPGLGQIYNRRYWKIPIVVGAFVGLGYGTAWNNRMLGDYTRGYRDLTDNDPNTNSYKEFFHSTVDVNSLDKAWLEKTFKAKKDFYRRNRDLSIICMVGMYLLCMVDAYVDASLAQFDVSSDLSMNVSPQIIAPTDHSSRPSFGVQWSLNF